MFGQARPDLFLNFRGRDIRKGFIDHLVNGVESANFSVFKDDCDLRGKRIETGLSRAIEQSKVAIPVISPGYGSSKWCLWELSYILHCRIKLGLEVLPIFYDVDLSDVRDQTGKFGKAFRKLARHHSPEQVKEWKDALRAVARIGGWSSSKVADGRQGQLVKMVVEKVSSVLNPSWIEQIPMFGKKSRKNNCQVFMISSPATTKTFASHLSYRLEREKISVFRDYDQYLIGKDVDREVRNAMDHCKIFIPIISEDFASSRDCLDKLVQMGKCVEKNGQQILPVFYEVDPSQEKELQKILHFFYEVNPSQEKELRHLFWLDMLRHDVPQEIRQQWLESFDRVWSIGGFVSENIGNGNGGELADAVLQEVVKSLQT